MSYIHEALKKAQKEREIGYEKYSGILSTREKETKFFHDSAGWWIALFVIIIFLAFTSYSWLDFWSPETKAKNEYERPAAATRPEGVADAKESYGRARYFHKRGLLQDARRLYQETLRIDPGHVDALNNLAVIYIHDRDFRAAQRGLEKAIRLKPQHVDPYYNLACLYALRGEMSKSLVHLKKAASLDQSVKEWARQDTDLDNIRGLSEFDEIIKP